MKSSLLLFWIEHTHTQMDEWQAATARETNGVPRRPNVLIGVTGSVASIKLAKLVELLNARQVGSIRSVCDFQWGFERSCLAGAAGECEGRGHSSRPSLFQEGGDCCQSVRGRGRVDGKH